MIPVPLGHSAYKRLSAGTPEIQVENRWLEANPTNLEEGAMLLSRPGTSQLAQLTNATLNPSRANFSKRGLFNGDLFSVSGYSLYRIAASDNTITPISGFVSSNDVPQCAWMKGAGYEYLFITAGDQLQVYQGLSKASGILTLTGTVTDASDTVQIGGVYYKWNTVVAAGSGTSASPWSVKIKNVGAVYDPLGQLLLAIMAAGTPGVDYSSGIVVPHPSVSATSTGVVPATSLTLSALNAGANGNAITTVVSSAPPVPPGPGVLVASTSGDQTISNTTGSTPFTVTASASGGTGGYTYSWSVVSSGGTGSGAFTSSTSTSSVQYTSSSPSAGQSFVAYIKCTVTDSAGNMADSTTTQLLYNHT